MKPRFFIDSKNLADKYNDLQEKLFQVKILIWTE